jgi:hypothetical protein
VRTRISKAFGSRKRSDIAADHVVEALQFRMI